MKKSLLFTSLSFFSLGLFAQKIPSTAGMIFKADKLHVYKNNEPINFKPQAENTNRDASSSAACTDKVKYVDRSGAPAAANKVQVGGALGWEAFIQVYPSFTGQVTRIDFTGGKFTATETAELYVHPLSSGSPNIFVSLGMATVSVNAVTGEFGATFSSPINVTGGFAVSVQMVTPTTDSIFVNYTDQTSFDDYSYLYYAGMYSALLDYGADIDACIRPTIGFTLPAPTITATPATTCTGSLVNFSGVDPTLAHYSNPVYNPGGWLSHSLSFGDATPNATSFFTTHSYSTTGTKTATGSVVYDGWTTDCTSSGTTTITVNPGITSSFGWYSTNLAVTFVNYSTGATSYAWQFGDAGTSAAPNPVHNYAASGTYTVELTTNGSCGSAYSTTNISITDSTSIGGIGIIEIEDGLLTNIYPNPASANLTIDITLEQSENVLLQVMDLNGQLVYAKNMGFVKTGLQVIDVTNFAQGLYFVRIVHNDQISTRKFVKE